jgi:hypothetical protein
MPRAACAQPQPGRRRYKSFVLVDRDGDHHLSHCPADADHFSTPRTPSLDHREASFLPTRPRRDLTMDAYVSSHHRDYPSPPSSTTTTTTTHSLSSLLTSTTFLHLVYRLTIVARPAPHSPSLIATFPWIAYVSSSRCRASTDTHQSASRHVTATMTRVTTPRH